MSEIFSLGHLQLPSMDSHAFPQRLPDRVMNKLQSTLHSQFLPTFRLGEFDHVAMIEKLPVLLWSQSSKVEC